MRSCWQADLKALIHAIEYNLTISIHLIKHKDRYCQHAVMSPCCML